MKMQDQINELSRQAGRREELLIAAQKTIDQIDKEALAISEIEAIVQKRLQRRGYRGIYENDQTNTGAMVRVFSYVAEMHGVELRQHKDSIA